MATNYKIRQPIVTVCGHVDSGKCVSGETLISLTNGSIKDAKTIFEENFNETESKKIEDGVFQDISTRNICVFSFDGISIVKKEISHIWRRQADKLIEIKITSGDIIKTTPEHPFYIYNKGLKEIRADEITENDYIAIPKKLSIEDSSIEETIIARLKNMKNLICFLNSNFDSQFRKFVSSNFDEIEKILGIRHLRDSLRNRRLRAVDLFKIGRHYNISEKKIYSCVKSIKNSDEKQRAGHTSKELLMPNLKELEKMGYILGCLAGDGHITKTNAILNNNDEDVINAYSSCLKEVFNLDSKVKQGHTCKIVLDKCGRTFSRFISEIGDIPVGNKSAIIQVPEFVYRNKEMFKGFFAGFFDTDGYVSKSKNTIEITSKSEKIIRQCSILLLNFGIHASVSIKKGYYVLKMSGKIYLNKFIETFKPRLKRRLVRVVESAEKAVSNRTFDIFPFDKHLFKSFKFSGKVNKKVPYYSKYLKSQNLSSDFMNKVIVNIREENDFSREVRTIMNSEILFVKVSSKKEIKNKDGCVYDFTVPETHNFVAERVLIHNTSILDKFRGTDVQESEAGGITQKISFTKYPVEQICKSCPMLEKSGINLELPGFLFIDTPGHAAFTNLRKRGGSLADLAIVVVSIKEGIMPQTAEVLQILKTNKTPFLVALNKIDTISGWQRKDSVKESIENQAVHVKQEFDLALMQFQASLQEHGFESDLFYEVSDFTKKIALVPCSAKTREGISELLFVLCGLCQKFLKQRLKMNEEAKGVILEVKKSKSGEWAEAILHDGILEEGDEIVIASFDEPIIAKVRTLAEIVPLSHKFNSVTSVSAATGVKIQFSSSHEILPGMPFQKISSKKEIETIKSSFKRDISKVLELDKQGVIIKADSLGSLEAMITLLKQEKIQILKAGIGPIGKIDLSAAKANLDTNPLDATVLGFNVNLDEDAEIPANVKIFTNEVIYKLIEDISLWRKEKSNALLKEKLLGLATICKLEILHQYVFRNSNPAVFGVRVLAGKLKAGIPLIDQDGEEVAHVKSMQHEKATVESVSENQEIAVSLAGIAFDRRLKDSKYLYANISDKQFKEFKKNKDILSSNELKVLQEVADIKRKKQESWGI